MRYAESEITVENWAEATLISDPPSPEVAGTLQNYAFSAPEVNITYFFGLKTIDDNQNISDLSNIVNAICLSDQTPPAAITDLSAAATETVIELYWTAPGDDGNVGSADHYEIRMYDEEITETNWGEAEILPGPPWPLSAGSQQSYTVEDLAYNQTYFFAIKAFDDNGNVSDVSNSPSGSLINDITPPADITDLTVFAGTASNLSTIKIQWIAPGDDGMVGTADHYEIRYSLQQITSGNWENATLFANPPTPLIAGSSQYCNVTGLNAATIYYFAVKAFDEAGNTNAVSNSPAGKIVYQINTGMCHNCPSRCVNDCTHGAILQGPGYKYIDPDLCQACGDCNCPWSLIHPAVVAY